MVNGEYVPPFVNAQRTPIGEDGNFLSRMGLRPLTMLQEVRFPTLQVWPSALSTRPELASHALPHIAVHALHPLAGRGESLWGTR